MAPAPYQLSSHWRVRGTPGVVFDILSKAEDLPRWWPAVFTESLPIQTGDETGKARVVRLESRGFLPRRMRWHVVSTKTDPPHRLVTEVWGDINGAATWTIEQDTAGFVRVDYESSIRPRIPLAGLLAPLVEPLFAANYRWAMGKGELSLQIELDRLHAATADTVRLVPAPPPSGVQPPPWIPAFGLGALVALVMLAVRGKAKGPKASGPATGVHPEAF